MRTRPEGQARWCRLWIRGAGSLGALFVLSAVFRAVTCLLAAPVMRDGSHRTIIFFSCWQHTPTTSRRTVSPRTLLPFNSSMLAPSVPCCVAVAFRQCRLGICLCTSETFWLYSVPSTPQKLKFTVCTRCILIYLYSLWKLNYALLSVVCFVLFFVFLYYARRVTTTYLWPLVRVKILFLDTINSVPAHLPYLGLTKAHHTETRCQASARRCCQCRPSALSVLLSALRVPAVAVSRAFCQHRFPLSNTLLSVWCFP